MGRPREFDRKKAVKQAMEAFWEHGYEGTSTAVLEERMAIGRSSFYSAFGSKDDLYAEAMDCYIEELGVRVIEGLTIEGPALDVLRAFFDGVTRRGNPGGERLRCCLIVRATISGAARMPAIACRIDRAMTELDDAFHGLLLRAREEGTIRRSGSLRGLARFLTTVFQGLNVAANAGRSRRELQDIIRPALAALEINY